MSWPPHLMSSSPYRYAPLENATTTRLLKILPERVDDCVVCLLEHFSHDQVNRSENFCYMAVLNIWDDSFPIRRIKLGNADDRVLHGHKVREDIWQFVIHVQAVPDMSRFVFWIDCLCLDQDSPAEWIQQSNHMHEIYPNAVVTIVWLGRSWTERDFDNGETFVVLSGRIEALIEQVDRSSIKAQIQSVVLEDSFGWSDFLRSPSSLSC